MKPKSKIDEDRDRYKNKEQAHVSDFVFKILRFKTFLKSKLTFSQLNVIIYFVLEVYEVSCFKIELKTRNRNFLIDNASPRFRFRFQNFRIQNLSKIEIYILRA